ncbi:MAG: DUF5916 domain-containing protein [Bryobacteraceae bacterium]
MSAIAQEQSAEAHLRRLQIPKVTRAPRLADFLNGTPREGVLAVSDFRQYSPGDGIPITQPTTAYLSYDSKNLYVAFVCKDDPKLIRAHLAKHDQILTDDRVIINIDTFLDRRHMYWFDINPYGVQADGNITDGVEDSPSWDTLWYAEGRITEDGYVVLATIPFKSLRFPAKSEHTWGLILGRYIQRNNEIALWPYLSSRKPGWVQQGGDLEGLRDISPGRNMQFIPYGLYSRSRYLDAPPSGAPGLLWDTEARGGVDAKVVWKDAFTLDVAVNPDFSQVESDEPQVTVNQRYEVYFPEKRPFFLENARFFTTPQTLFFSRRIADPRFGARLTGKLGPWSLGAMFADDRGPGKTTPAGSAGHGDHSPVGVFRLQREFTRNGRNSNVGVIATSQEFAGSYNRVYAVDAQWQILRNWLIQAQATGSNTREMSGQKLAGPSYRAGFYHQGRHFISETRYLDISPNFRSWLGFFPRLDIRELHQRSGYQWRYDQGWLQSLGPEFTGAINYDRQGRLRDWNLVPEFRMSLIRGTDLSIYHEQAYELYQGRGFRRPLSAIRFRTEWLSRFWIQAQWFQGAAINYNPSAGLPPFLGQAKRFEGAVTLRPEARLQIEGTYLFSELRTGEKSGLSGAHPGEVVFQNHLIRAKFNYQFNRRHSLRFIADYDSVLPNSKWTSLSKEKRLGLDALYTYMLNPGTALYLGFTDQRENYRLDPFRSPALYRTTGLDLSTGRQFFVKLSYLLRF